MVSGIQQGVAVRPWRIVALRRDYIVIAVPTEALSGGQPAVRRTPKTPWIVAYADAHGVRVAYLDDQMLRQLGDTVSHTNLPQKLRSASE